MGAPGLMPSIIFLPTSALRLLVKSFTADCCAYNEYITTYVLLGANPFLIEHHIMLRPTRNGTHQQNCETDQ